MWLRIRARFAVRPSGPDPPDPDETTAISVPPSAASRVGLDAGPVAPAPADLRAPSKHEREPSSVSQGPVGGGGTLQVRPWHYALFVGLVGVAVLVAVALSGGFDRLRFEDPEGAGTSRVEAFGVGVLGPVEVSGIRPYYDGDYKARGRAFVANHSREETSVAYLALLRVREASNDAPPLATFEVVISNPLPPNQGMEIDVPLRAMGTLQSPAAMARDAG